MPLHVHRVYASIDCQPLHEDACSIHVLIIVSALLHLTRSVKQSFLDTTVACADQARVETSVPASDTARLFLRAPVASVLIRQFGHTLLSAGALPTSIGGCTFCMGTTILDIVD